MAGGDDPQIPCSTCGELGAEGSCAREPRRCPACGAWILFRTDYEYLTKGSEDEQLLTRLTAAEATALTG